MYNYQPPLNYDNNNNPFGRILEKLKTALPDSNYQKNLLLRGEFNNEIAAGMSQGLTLIDPEKDKSLFKQIDYDPLEEDKVKFDDVNQKLDENYYNRNAYKEGYNTIDGTIDAYNSWEKHTDFSFGLGDWFRKFYDQLKDNLGEGIAIIFLFLIVYKKI